MEIDDLPPQRTAEVSCPHVYTMVELYIQSKLDEGQQAAASVLCILVRSAMKQMYGVAGAAALGYEILGPVNQDQYSGAEGGDGSGESGARAAAIVRMPKESFGKFTAACAVMSSYDGAPCTLSVTRASPHLACLAGAGADSSLAADCLQRLAASSGQ
ncbi:hypothetical protein DUNSADRAFT_14120 [Dunaliella salina]|uniref:Uncharacterized protein n=1 Tax=Dunaliella salina TaxID=3046 RepID=A0ABQ7G7Y0_DUNSA|nr:hypothetical protein DUNSADRAFT_14120 [Dunaliella salina]|eukprot:KAF5830714.1 hypothetical protein DUNSADRAFT_14120 [Dunaliella salina]